MKQFLLALFLTLAITQGFGQSDAVAKSYNISQSQNGLNSICVYYPQLSGAEVTIVIRSGSIYEREEQRGLAALLHEVVSQKLRKNLNNSSSRSFKFFSEAGVENTVFKFKAPHAELQQLLDFISQNLVNLEFEQGEITKAVEALNAQRNDFKTAHHFAYQRILQHQLFKFDLDKINYLADSSTLAKYTVLDVDSFYKLYYSPVASTIVVQSNYQPFTLLGMVEKSFVKWLKADFNPDEFTKIRSIKPVIYSTQNTILNNPEQSKITLATLSYGTRSYTRGSYFAYLLNAMINDTTMPIFKKLKEETGTSKIQATYEANNYFGVFSITAYPPDESHQEVYNLLRKAISELHLYINESSVAAAKKKFETEYNAFKGTSSFFNKSARHFFSNSTDYFESLNDSVQAINTALFLRNTYTTFCNANFAAIAETDSAHFQSENYTDWFADIDETIANEKFTYRKNVCSVEGEANKQLLNRLMQWLKVNPDMQCQINGKADKKEFDKFKDEAVWAFIDTIETFRKYKPDLLKTGIMRPELLRSLTILRALSEGGIEFERLSGTAISLSSKSKEEEAENRVATITLTRLKNRLPLRDIRIFGK